MIRFALSPALVLLLLIPDSDPRGGRRAHLVWDGWGVPHVYAQGETDLFHALGWAHMENHGDQMLLFYGQARGKAASYWGEDYLEEDRQVHLLDIPARSQRWLTAQEPAFLIKLNAYVRGANTYAKRNPDKLNPALAAVLPIQAEDVLGHVQRVFHFADVTHRLGDSRNTNAFLGSNAWALAPGATARHRSLMMANPHFSWHGNMRLMEVHLNNGGMNLYGASPVGLPMVLLGFTQEHAWTHTANDYKGNDYYELDVIGEGYRNGDQVVPFEEREITIDVKRGDTVSATREVVRDTVMGPVISLKGGKALAVHTYALDRPNLLAQYWDMASARSMVQFEAALAQQQQPLFSTMYSDASGNVLYHFGGVVPRREGGSWEQWSGPLPVDWFDPASPIMAYDELPRVHNPPSSRLQNSNDPPWFVTDSSELRANMYPDWLVDNQKAHPRAQRSRDILYARASFSLQDLEELRFDTRLVTADVLVPKIAAAAGAYSGGWGLQAADLLRDWSRRLDAESVGGVVFTYWMEAMEAEGYTLDRLMDGDFSSQTAALTLDKVADELLDDYGTISVPWGQVHRLRSETLDLPANGGAGRLGSFHVLGFAGDEGGKRYVTGGETFSMVVQLGEHLEARVLNVRGNASQSHSTHRDDQLKLLSRRMMRDVLFSKEAVNEAAVRVVRPY